MAEVHKVPPAMQVSIAVEVQVQYYGPAPIYPGMDQLNIRIPGGAHPGVVLVVVGSVSSNAVTLAIS